MARAFDIVVAGAGPVGRAFAASLAGAGLRNALVDPQPEAALADPADDGKEIALTDHSVAMLAALGAWARIPASQVAPLRRMQVLNGPRDGHGVVRVWPDPGDAAAERRPVLRGDDGRRGRRCCSAANGALFAPVLAGMRVDGGARARMEREDTAREAR